MSSAICFNLDRSKILSVMGEPFPKCQCSDSPNLKEFADGNFKSDENGTKFLNSVENTVEKGEIAR